MDIDVRELLDEDAFDPKKLFDEKQYSTLIIDREGFNKKQNSAADLIEGLLEPEVTRAESEAIFLKLKEGNARELLVDSIKHAGRVSEKAILAGACWESGIDFTGDVLFFVELACQPDFKLAMEALTVIQECEGPIDNNTAEKALELASKATANSEIINDLKEAIRSKAQ